jgi:hypothetical protein
MRVFREMTIRGDPEAISRLLNELSGVISGGWVRNLQAEQRVASAAEADLYCFSCLEADGRPAGDLWLRRLSPVELTVSNIVPAGKQQLDVDEYNRIIKEFYDSFVKPVASRVGLTATLSSDEVTMDQWVSPDTARLLHVAAVNIRKSGGLYHPLDEERWLAFVVGAHKEGSPLDPVTLRRWLEEEERLPEEQAVELAEKYENARSLLAYYDK